VNFDLNGGLVGQTVSTPVGGGRLLTLRSRPPIYQHHWSSASGRQRRLCRQHFERPTSGCGSARADHVLDFGSDQLTFTVRCSESSRSLASNPANNGQR